MPTEMAPDTFQAYISAWKERQKLQEKHLMQLVTEARSIALRLADLLVSRYGASEVWLFGSLARSRTRPGIFGKHSDIDLAVRGLPPEKYFHILSMLNAEANFGVDLIDMDACPPWLLETISRDGELLAKRKEDIK